MRAPGLKALQEQLGLSPEKAKLIRRLAEAVDDAKALETLVSLCPKTMAYVNRMHSDPYRSSMWRRTVMLTAMDEVMETYGVEPLGPVGMSGPPYEYLNAGDTYNATLIYKKKTDTLTIGSWGDIAEKHPSWE
jgi:hypothetical protein